ncbi:MAG: type II holin [Spirochaetia bacterium]|nr:type II holin [Spirochaetia bacterium]
MLSIDFDNGIVKAAPIAGTAAADVASRLILGLSLHEWFYVAAIVYTLCQCWALIYKTIKGGKSDERQNAN